MAHHDDLDFAGKTVFVAGGSSGINLGIADAFAAHGANVAIASRSQERVDGAVQQLARTAAGWQGSPPTSVTQPQSRTPSVRPSSDSAHSTC